MGKKNKDKKKHKKITNCIFQIFGWVLVISMASLIGYRTYQMFSPEMLSKIRKDPTITRDTTIVTYYLYGR